MTGAKGVKQDLDPMVLQVFQLNLMKITQTLSEAEATVEVVRKTRDKMIRQAGKLGLTLRDIAPLAGLTVARVQQIEVDTEADDDPALTSPEAALKEDSEGFEDGARDA